MVERISDLLAGFPKAGPVDTKGLSVATAKIEPKEPVVVGIDTKVPVSLVPVPTQTQTLKDPHTIKIHHKIDKPALPAGQESIDSPHDPTGAILEQNVITNESIQKSREPKKSVAGVVIHSVVGESHTYKLAKLKSILQLRCSDSQNVEHAMKEIKTLFGF